MSANVEGMVREGVTAFKAGRADEARALLSKAVELDPYNEQGWLWLSGVVTSVDDQRTCLENVLAINPGNSRARSGLDYLVQQSAPSTPPAAEAEPDSSAESQPEHDQPDDGFPEPAPAVVPPILTPIDSVPSSVEWGAYDDTPPADDEDWHSPAPAPSGEFDDWVSGLQLGGATATGISDDPFSGDAGGASPFFDSVDLSPAASTPSPFGPSSFVLPPADDDATPAPVAVVSPSAWSASDDETANAAPPVGPANLADVEVDDDELELPEGEDELFPEIPREIKATRLPGTSERGPLLLKLAAVLLIPLNIVAAALVLWKLFSFI